MENETVEKRLMAAISVHVCFYSNDITLPLILFYCHRFKRMLNFMNDMIWIYWTAMTTRAFCPVMFLYHETCTELHLSRMTAMIIFIPSALCIFHSQIIIIIIINMKISLPHFEWQCLCVKVQSIHTVQFHFISFPLNVCFLCVLTWINHLLLSLLFYQRIRV